MTNTRDTLTNKIETSIAYELSELDKIGLSTQESKLMLMKHSGHAHNIIMGLKELKKVNLANQSHFKLLIEHRAYARELSAGLSYLGQRKAIYTTNNLQLMTQYPQHALGIANGLAELENADLSSQANSISLVKYPYYALSIAEGLSRLKQGGIAIQDNYDLLVRHAPYAKGVAYALVQLRQVKLDTYRNKKLILEHDQYAFDIALCLFRINQLGLASQENFNIIIQNKAYAREIVEASKDMFFGQQSTFHQIIHFVSSLPEPITNQRIQMQKIFSVDELETSPIDKELEKETTVGLMQQGVSIPLDQPVNKYVMAAWGIFNGLFTGAFVGGFTPYFIIQAYYYGFYGVNFEEVLETKQSTNISTERGVILGGMVSGAVLCAVNYGRFFYRSAKKHNELHEEFMKQKRL